MASKIIGYEIDKRLVGKSVNIKGVGLLTEVPEEKVMTREEKGYKLSNKKWYPGLRIIQINRTVYWLKQPADFDLPYWIRRRK